MLMVVLTTISTCDGVKLHEMEKESKTAFRFSLFMMAHGGNTQDA